MTFPRLTLKAKLALCGGLAILVCMALLTGLLLRAMENDVRRSVALAHTALVDARANDLDERLHDVRNAVVQNALVLSGATQLPSLERLTEIFYAKPVLRGMFDSLFVIDATGRVVYDHPRLPGRIGLNVADRDYFRDMLRTGQAVVSSPVRSKASGDPVIVITAPIRSAEGRIIGALTGSINLMGKNFLGELRTQKIGEGGYFAIAAKGQKPVVVVHPRAERMLSPVSPRSANPTMWKALEGFEGTVEGPNSAGLASIFSYKSLQSVPWVLVAVYPAAEAYASLERTEQEMKLLAAALTLVGVAVFFGVTGRLLQPLTALRRGMERNASQPEEMAPVAVRGSPEIASVMQAYNAFLAMRDEYQQALRQSEERTRAILTHAPDAFISIDPSGHVVEWNRQAELTFGWSRAEALGQSVASLIIPPTHRAAHEAGLQVFRGSGEGSVINQRIEVPALCRDGRIIPVEMSIASVATEQGWAANAFLHDISARRRAQEQLQASEQRLRLIADNLPVLVSYIDHEHRFQFANETFREWVGVDPKAIIGKHAVEAIGGRLYEERRPYYEQALRGERVEFETSRETRERIWHLRSIYIPDVLPDGRVAGFYGLSVDVSGSKEIEQHLRHLARFDTLTGLPNRRYLEEKLEESMARARRLRAPMALLFLDVDHFKQINDRLGHAVGDDVLKQFGARLKTCVRETDTVARLAGDEFVIVLENLRKTAEAELVAEKVANAMQVPIDAGDGELVVSTSIGIALYQGETMTSSALLAKADAALYEVKRAGRAHYGLAKDV
ncbi:diguanylate cyclase [Caldimonas brevitalea]|uniref:Diguanylate cyclase n=2 Tax=Caldimonas brevitalea TaxID=413882 RepID=A0A0G3BLE0_9BURK|nr:diguanylate cyclase [Caldimonas brevitalea]